MTIPPHDAAPTVTSPTVGASGVPKTPAEAVLNPPRPASAGPDTGRTSAAPVVEVRPAQDVPAWTYRVLLALTAGVAAVTFALSYYGIRDYAERIMALPRWMSWLAPVAVDVFSLVGLVSAIGLATATWRSRTYAWCIFVVAAAASVGANTAHASHRGLSWEGVVGAAAAPLFFLLSSHLAVVVRRHVVSQRASLAPAVVSHPESPVEAPAVSYVAPVEPQVSADVAPAPVSRPTSPAVSLTRDSSETAAAEARPPLRKATPPRPATRPVARQSDEANRRTARRRVTRGESCATVAVSLGVSKKSVERWTQDIRLARQNGSQSSDTDATADDDQERHLGTADSDTHDLIGATA